MYQQQSVAVLIWFGRRLRLRLHKVAISPPGLWPFRLRAPTARPRAREGPSPTKEAILDLQE